MTNKNRLSVKKHIYNKELICLLDRFSGKGALPERCVYKNLEYIRLLYSDPHIKEAVNIIGISQKNKYNILNLNLLNVYVTSTENDLIGL